MRFCAVCGNVAEEEQCRICRDPRRDPSVICVVEESKDVVAIERTREFRGRYHVLGGAISPIDGIGPDDLRIRELMTRLADGAVTEVILATDPNLEGEATATYLARLLKPMGLRVTRLASGLPVGGDLEYADEVTSGRAFEGRRLHATVVTSGAALDRSTRTSPSRSPNQVDELPARAAGDRRAATGGERRSPLLLLEVSQVLLAGARLGASQDFIPPGKYQPDVGPDPDLDAHAAAARPACWTASTPTPRSSTRTGPGRRRPPGSPTT